MLKFLPLKSKELPEYLFCIAQKAQSNKVKISAIDIHVQKNKLVGSLDAFPEIIGSDKLTCL